MHEFGITRINPRSGAPWSRVFRMARTPRCVEDNPEVEYVVVYLRSRVFRKFADAAIAKRILATMGVKLVSVKEEFGEGYVATPWKRSRTS